MPGSALIVVDVQNDFALPSGALSVPGGEAILDRVNALMRSGEFDLVVATRDWHPADHSSFPDAGGRWPVHCVAGTPGAELHASLDASAADLVVDKGTGHAEAYSGFDATGLGDDLRARGIDAVTVVGLATDYCVLRTALDGLAEGFTVTVDPSAIAAVDVQPGDGERALDEIRAAGGTVSS